MKIKVWMLVSDTDEGTHAGAYATESEAYGMLTTCTFSHLQPHDEDYPTKQKAEAALETGQFETVRDIVGEYIEGSCDYYAVQEDSLEIPDPLSSPELLEALKLMVATYPYDPPCHGWQAKAAAHDAAKKAIARAEARAL